MRVGAQQWTYEPLLDIATAGAIERRENAALGWLAETWNIEVVVAPARD